MTVAAPEKTVKKINSQMGRAAHTGHTGNVAVQPDRVRGEYPQQRRTSAGSTVRQGTARNTVHSTERRNVSRQAASMTIGAQHGPQESDDDFEEI